MPKLVIVVNKWRNTSRQKKVIAPVSASDEDVINSVKANEPFIREDETFSVLTSQTLTDDSARIISQQYGVITMKVRASRSKKQYEKI